MTEPPKYDAFISYRHSDSALARQLCDALRSLNYSVFLDREMIRPGESVRVAVERALYASKAFVPLFNADIDREAHLYLELGLYLGLKREHHKIIPVVTDQFRLASLPADLTSVDVVRWDANDPQQGLKEIVQALGAPVGALPVEVRDESGERRISVELTIEKGAHFSIEQQEEFLKRITELLNTDAIRVQSRRDG